MPTKQNVKPQSRPVTRQPEPETQPEEVQERGNAPADRVSVFPVSASIWMRYSQDGRPMYSVSFQRTYKAADGHWQYTGSFNASDLLALAECARVAFHKIAATKRLEEANPNGRGPQQRYRAPDEDVPF